MDFNAWRYTNPSDVTSFDKAKYVHVALNIKLTDSYPANIHVLFFRKCCLCIISAAYTKMHTRMFLH